MKLEMLETGKRAVIARIHGGNGKRNNLLDLGLVPGVPVRMIQGGRRGPVILEVLGSRVILGHGLADAVEVS